MQPSSLRMSASGLDIKGPQQVTSNLPNRNQVQRTRVGSGMGENTHRSSQQSSPTTSSRNDRVVVKSQETSLAPHTDWAQCVAQNPAGSCEGLIEDYRSLFRLHLSEICAAVKRHPSKIPALELFVDDLQRRSNWWHDDLHQANQRLVWAPSIRKELITRLTVLVLDLQPCETKL